MYYVAGVSLSLTTWCNMSPMSKRWTLKETDFLFNNLDKSIEYIKQNLPNRSDKSILLKKMELFSPECIENNKFNIIIDYSENKIGLKTVAKKYNVSPTCLFKKLTEWGVKTRNRSNRKDLMGSNNRNWTGHGDIPGGMFSDIKRDAGRRQIDFSITIEYAWDLFLEQDKKCIISGVSLIINSNRKIRTASLDRKNYMIGYTKGNVQWVHKNINIMKNRFSDEEFIEWCRIVNKYQSEK